MLKLSDPFEMNDLFVGIFYNPETEAMANAGEGSQKSNQRLERLYRRLRVVWRKLWCRFVERREAVAPIRQPEALTPESRDLPAVPNESAAWEFRPLTNEEKRQFFNSLNEDGRRILAELAGKSKKGRSRRSVAPVVKPSPVSIAPDMGTSDKGMVHDVVPPMT
jgi:hypothetical protein